MVGAVALMGLSAESVIQGILVTGATVLTNQVVKQSSKVE
ncbi:phage holin family protein [Clostridium sp.]|nr:phage holin family protein [Clostridium sp.]MDU4726411.1 phage holin family protein [Clostridium sp.]